MTKEDHHKTLILRLSKDEMRSSSFDTLRTRKEA